MEKLEIGCLVGFVNTSQNELNQRFIVLEDRDSRVLVQDYNDFSFLPATFCYFKSDLQIIKK